MLATYTFIVKCFSISGNTNAKTILYPLNLLLNPFDDKKDLNNMHKETIGRQVLSAITLLCMDPEL